jgi:hypothetical protein
VFERGMYLDIEKERRQGEKENRKRRENDGGRYVDIAASRRPATQQG